MRHWMKYFFKTWNLIWYFITYKTNLVSRLAIISLTSLILFMLSLTLLIIVLLPRAVLVGVIFRTFAMFIPCGLFRKLSISSSAFSAPSDDWNLSMGCNAKRSTPVLHHLLTYKKKPWMLHCQRGTKKLFQKTLMPIYNFRLHFLFGNSYQAVKSTWTELQSLIK